MWEKLSLKTEIRLVVEANCKSVSLSFQGEVQLRALAMIRDAEFSKKLSGNMYENNEIEPRVEPWGTPQEIVAEAN